MQIRSIRTVYEENTNRVSPYLAAFFAVNVLICIFFGLTSSNDNVKNLSASILLLNPLTPGFHVLVDTKC